jgi:hypothetical protein
MDQNMLCSFMCFVGDRLRSGCSDCLRQEGFDEAGGASRVKHRMALEFPSSDEMQERGGDERSA